MVNSEKQFSSFFQELIENNFCIDYFNLSYSKIYIVLDTDFSKQDSAYASAQFFLYKTMFVLWFRVESIFATRSQSGGETTEEYFMAEFEISALINKGKV